MKYITAVIFALFALSNASGQDSPFRMVSNGTPSWSVVDDSTYSATINFQSDLTGQSFLANQIVVGFRLFTPTEQLYRVSAVTGTTFSSATIEVVEISNDYTTTNGQPQGQCMIFNPDGRETIPDAPFGSTGATANMNQAVATYNARAVQPAEEATPAESLITYETQTVGGANFDLAYMGDTVTVTNPSGGEYTMTLGNGTDLIWATVTGDDGTLNASQEMVLNIDNSTNSAPRRFIVQLYDENNDGLVDQQITSTNHTQGVTTNTTTITVPGLNGFGATGYKIELR